MSQIKYQNALNEYFKAKEFDDKWAKAFGVVLSKYHDMRRESGIEFHKQYGQKAWVERRDFLQNKIDRFRKLRIDWGKNRMGVKPFIP